MVQGTTTEKSTNIRKTKQPVAKYELISVRRVYLMCADRIYFYYGDEWITWAYISIVSLYNGVAHVDNNICLKGMDIVLLS